MLRIISNTHYFFIHNKLTEPLESKVYIVSVTMLCYV